MGGRLVEITDFLFDEPNVTKLNINADTTAQQVINILLKRPFYVRTSETFQLSANDELFSDDFILVKSPHTKFQLESTGIGVKVKIEETGTEEFFDFPKEMTVKEVTAIIELSNLKSIKYYKTNMNINISPCHELYLVSDAQEKSKIVGTLLEPSRKIVTYNLKPSDVLILSRKKPFGKRKNNQEEFEVKIICPERNIAKKMRFSVDASYEEIKSKFLEAANIFECKYFYSLFLEPPNESFYLLPFWNFRSFPLPSPEQLVCKKVWRPKREWFGVDPETLPMSRDPENGLVVPDVILLLKDCLKKLSGYSTEGIFRKAGLESEMKTLKETINNGSPFVCDNVHSIATLLKRWYKELPSRIFFGINYEPLMEDQQALKKYHQVLNNMNTTLFSWLLDLLIKVVAEEKDNLMDPKNCGIVWGPGLVGSSNDGPASGNVFEGFNDTRFGVNVVECNLSHLIEQNALPIGCFKEFKLFNATCLYDHPIQTLGEIDLKKGDKVIVYETTLDWCFVQFANRYGFVSKPFLAFD